MTGVQTGALDAFTSFATLLLPADPTRLGIVAQAGERWRLDPGAVPPEADAVVWGRLPAPGRTPALAALRWAAARERALRDVRRSGLGRLPVRAIHRLPPPATGGASVRARLREAVKGGAVVELGSSDLGPRLIDAVAAAAGAGPAHGLVRGSGGAALARARHADGTALLLRAAPAGSAYDPAPTAAALERLQSAGVTVAPAPRGTGRLGHVSWTAESLLHGGAPRRLSPGLARTVVEVCARLPMSDAPPTAPQADLAVLSAALPARSASLASVADALTGAFGRLPSVLRHGDLWTGNLLVTGRALTGIVDWDAMHPHGVCGADLLQLVATEQRHRRGQSLGAAWLSRPWAGESFRSAAAPYWRAIGVDPTGPVGELVGVAWWTAAVAGTLSRAPWRATDERWVRTNVDPVLTALGWRP